MSAFARISYTFEGQDFTFPIETTEDGLKRLKARLIWAKHQGVKVLIESTIG